MVHCLPLLKGFSVSVNILQVDKILKIIPKERRTYLYSATMTKKVTVVFDILPFPKTDRRGSM